MRLVIKLLFLFSIFLQTQVLADKACFLAKENNTILKQEGDCKSRHSPCSSFKIAISLMSYDKGILIDDMHPVRPFINGYADWIETWKQPHNPTLWMKNSCVWYSQINTRELGMSVFKEYIIKFNYGNMDVSGDKGQANGLTNSWLSSSLKISPEEQTIFLQKFLDRKLNVAPKAYEITKKLLFVDELSKGWKLYGKIGMGFVSNKDETLNEELLNGWFVGWIEKGTRTIVFACYVEDEKKESIPAGRRAKELAKEKLKEVIKE